MEEPLTTIELIKDNNKFVIRFDTQNGKQEFKSKNLEDVLEQMVIVLQDEYEDWEE